MSADHKAELSESIRAMMPAWPDVSNPIRKALVEKKAGLWFGDTKEGLIDNYLTAKTMAEQAEEVSRQT
jgi:hypothetical protein